MLRKFTTRLVSREGGLMGMILAGGLGVRLLGVGRGLPYLHSGDEPVILSWVVGMLQRGDLNPHAFVYPSVYYYMLLPVVYLHYFYLHAHGMLSSPWEIELYHPQVPNNAYWWYLSPASFYLWGRTFTSLVGTATVYAIYRVGKAVYGTTAGLLAAAFLALAPGAVFYSDTVYVDIPMIFFVTVTVLAGLSIIRHGRWRDYILAGLLAGLAISTKPNAVIVVLALLVAHLVSSHRTRLVDRRVVVMGLCVLAGFAIGTPYVIISPHDVVGQARDSALAYGGIPDLASLRRGLPGYLAYFARPSQGGEWYIVPHTAMGLLPAAAALVGAVVGFRWNRRLHLYLLSFPLLFSLFMAGQRYTPLRSVLAVLPFAALFAAAACVCAWQWVEAHWPVAKTSWGRSLAGLMLVALLTVPGREAIALGWTMGRRPDTRTAAVAWLQRHVAPGARVAFEKDLRWYLPDLYRLPFALRFAPRNATLDWYLQQHIDVAVGGDQSLLKSLPVAAAFAPPPYLPRPREKSRTQNGAVIDPALSIVRPRMPEAAAAFPVEVGAGEMFLGPLVTRAAGVYSETVHLPYQPFPRGDYVLNIVTEEWPRFWTSPGDRLTRLMAQVRVGRRTIGEVTVAHTPLRYTAPEFRIDQAETLPVQIEFTFWTEPQTPQQRNQTGWALRPSAAGCALAPDAPSLNAQRVTLEAWVYLEGLNAPPGGMRTGLESEAPILSKGKHLGYYLRLVRDTSHRILADLSIAGKFSVGRAAFVPFRKWTHIAATYDGREARMYLNGVPASQVFGRSPRHEGRVHAEGAPLAIGCRDPGTPDQAEFRGLITGVRIWNRVLSFDEVRREAGLYQLPDRSPGLVGSWSFQSLDRGKVPDLSGAGNELGVKTLERVPLTSAPPARLAWPLRTVKIDRAMP